MILEGWNWGSECHARLVEECHALENLEKLEHQNSNHTSPTGAPSEDDGTGGGFFIIYWTSRLLSGPEKLNQKKTTGQNSSKGRQISQNKKSRSNLTVVFFFCFVQTGSKPFCDFFGPRRPRRGTWMKRSNPFEERRQTWDVPLRPTGDGAKRRRSLESSADEDLRSIWIEQYCFSNMF